MAGKNRATVTPVNPVLSNAEILSDLRKANGSDPVVPAKSQAQLIMEAEIERLKAENAGLRTAATARPSAGSVWLKVSEKRALSVYGLGRFPVTLYREQWERLFGQAEVIKAFIRENDKVLKVKGE